MPGLNRTNRQGSEDSPKEHTADSPFRKRITSGAATAAVVGWLAFSTAVPSAAAIDGMTNNWSNWWAAHAEIWIYNQNMGYQSVARLGDRWDFGARSSSHSRAHVDGYSWVHEAYQRRVW